mmetsp:Transcript_69042/g.114760  ORF Transcript_69042/g.114760 Transcript_69042/m.114760 type:complete len:272 (-) Transcript_69042:7-822(-)
MVADSLGGRGGGRKLASLNDGRTSLLHCSNELPLKPTLVELRQCWCSRQSCMTHIRVLRRRMISPNNDPVDVGSLTRAFLRQHRNRTVVVQSRQSRDVCLRNGWRRLGQNCCVGVRRISHDEAFHSRLCPLSKRQALFVEDADVFLHHILALHALFTRESTEEDGIVRISESNLSITCNFRFQNKGVSKVLNLHLHSRQYFRCRCNIKQMEYDGLIHSENRPTCDRWQKRVSNLTSTTCDYHSHWFLRHASDCSHDSNAQTEEGSCRVHQG